MKRERRKNFEAGAVLGSIVTFGLVFVIMGLGANGYLAIGLGVILWPVICGVLYGLFRDLDARRAN
jgi:type IV secretory pathway TrbD component